MKENDFRLKHGLDDDESWEKIKYICKAVNGKIVLVETIDEKNEREKKEDECKRKKKGVA